MRTNREELQQILETILGSRNVYFQPPESIKLKYPCIIYEKTDIEIVKANNKNYLFNERYTVTYITDDPDSDLTYNLLELPYCNYDRRFVSNNLNHEVFTIYH